MKTFIKILMLLLGMSVHPVAADDFFPSYDNWQDVGFARARLISCRSTFDVQTPLYLAVQIKSKDGYTVQPDLIPKADAHATVTMLNPFQQINDNTAFYPIPCTITSDNEPITFSVTGTLTGCQQQNCTTAPLNLSLTLKPGPAFLTVQCDDITNAISLTPIPMQMNQVTGWAIQNQSGASVTLDFQRKPLDIKIYNTDKKQLNLNTHLDHNRLTIDWPNASKNKDLSFFVRTNHAIYEIKLPLLPENTTIPPPPISFMTLFHLILFCVFFSPWVLFVGHVQIPKKTLHKQNILGLILLAVSAIGTIGFLCLTGHLPFFCMSKYVLFAVMIIGWFCAGFHPMVPLLLSYVTPIPYMDTFTHLSLEIQITLISIYHLVFMIAIGTQLYLEKSFYKIQNKDKYIYQIWWVAHLPYLAWILWCLFY